ncbi:TonB-dependent receptor [Elizabethkingia anophelis]|uniref:TonB-dependent receptor n=1 Tax=Elizabethkingia anophelis TaxID=1117645 RepID=A0AAE4T0E3_9FLAO|nr:TonB-dependent receptor [Elizabethkingia anophelis]MCT3950881.1 TonB-dependent receptor [Elizabethkingia anophelis]MCT3954424.1 TonB-dependent receptor [Elizabethkingia anophelis]MCT3986504.1 TonB-dependent receptor [Elizabethkingia anophelis]MCT4064688.1 TonB-dependent receptor [Elizabethkingia anophelis]
MKNTMRRISILGILCLPVIVFAQKDSILTRDTIKKVIDDKVKASALKEEANRNVMLNAANNTSPRDVNIGLPASVGGITILENDLPVVYIFWPELPNKTWRQSVGLEKTGLLKMDQMSLTMGDLGFAVNSYSQTGTQKLKLKGKFTTNTFGWLQGDVNVSGPVGNKGWTYTAGAFMNYDPGTYKLGFARNTDQTKIFRFGITKYFPQNKGKITMLYKYADSYVISNYALFRYGENGKVTELDNFRIGRDSYIVNDGKVKMLNSLTGDYYWAGLDSSSNTAKSHNIDLFGNYLLNSGWNFKFSTRFHFADVSMLNIIPLSIFSADSSKGYTIASTGQSYSGNIGTQLVQSTPKAPITSLQGRFSIDKKIGNHHVTVGLLEQYYKINKYTSDRSFFFQTAESQPQRLIGPKTDSDGFYNYNVGAEYHNGTENKLSVYANDEWKATDNLNLSYGLIIRNNTINGDYSLTPRKLGFTFRDAVFTNINYNWLQLGGAVNATYNILKSFGLLANFQYNEENTRLGSYSQAFEPNPRKIKSPLGGAGIFWNAKYIQLVSQVTFLKRNNYLQRYNLVNPSNTTQSENASVIFDIQTVGWTTDFVLKPFKGFNLHYLLTFQNPQYKKFNFSAFGKDYDYSDRNVVGIAKVLMEIDPSYTIDKWKFWASFRYFSKQYANLTNVLYFAPRWETFGGVNYTLNKNISVGATVINFLNQRGASGTINGAELITDPSPYYGRLLTGSYIMPFSVQLSTNINF